MRDEDQGSSLVLVLSSRLLPPQQEVGVMDVAALIISIAAIGVALVVSGFGI